LVHLRQAAREQQRGCGLADAALLIGDCPDLHVHPAPSMTGADDTTASSMDGASGSARVPGSTSASGPSGMARITSSTRRLELRPSGVSLSAIGWCSP